MSTNNLDEPWFGEISQLRKILLVEDNPLDSKMIETILNIDEQFEITVVTTLKTALETLTINRYDAIILDLNLPDEYGVNTFHRVKSANSDTAIIVLTGLEDRKTGIHLIKSGAQDFILKSKLHTYPLSNAILYGIERQANNRKIVSSEYVEVGFR